MCSRLRFTSDMSEMLRVRLESRTKVFPSASDRELILRDITCGGGFDGQMTRHQLRVALWSRLYLLTFGAYSELLMRRGDYLQLKHM